MDILNSLGQAILPGARVRRFQGWEALTKFAMPRDSEVIGIDADDSKNYLYMKKVDANGNEVCARYHYDPDPVEEFDPDKYVTVQKFNDFREEMKLGFDSIRKLITDSTVHPTRPDVSSECSYSANHGLGESDCNLPANGRAKSGSPTSNEHREPVR